LDADEKAIIPFDTPGGPQKCLVVNEHGLYQLVLQSRKPQAMEFKRWITHEVIPTIRETGGYIKNAEDMSNMEIPVQSPGSSEGDAG
jgi:anti-repressor protein